MHFDYYNPTQIFFGAEQIQKIEQAIPTNAKVLVLYGGGSIKRNGVYIQVEQALSQHQWCEFSGVEPNPSVETLDQAVQLVKEKGIDFILAVGGGSVIDGAKYIAAAACYQGSGWDILTGDYAPQEAIAIGAILTLPATGSESNGNSVISKAATQEKLAFHASCVYPKFAVLDPETMTTLPERQLQNGLVDAFVHVCEQYLTVPSGSLIHDGYAETILKSLVKLAQGYGQKDCPEWRANLMWCANQALNGLVGAGLKNDWATHAIGHQLTALYGVDHARSLAIIQPWLLRNQIQGKQQKLEQMGMNVFGLEKSEELAEQTIVAIEQLYHSLGVATQFTDYISTKEQAIDAVLEKLKPPSGDLVLGETQTIQEPQVRAILADAFSQS